MTQPSYYMAGATLVGMVEVIGPLSSYKDCQKVIPLQSGGVMKSGKPSDLWQYNEISYENRAIFRSLCPNGSAWVYINDLTTENVWKAFYCLMEWPLEENQQINSVLDFRLKFKFMIDVTP